jgi:hypothetical protein
VQDLASARVREGARPRFAIPAPCGGLASGAARSAVTGALGRLRTARADSGGPFGREPDQKWLNAPMANTRGAPSPSANPAGPSPGVTLPMAVSGMPASAASVRKASSRSGATVQRIS